MKIVILTHPLEHNYGGILQNYALQQTIIKLGHEPITLDHHNNDVLFVIKIMSYCKRFIGRLFGSKKPLSKFMSRDTYKLVFGDIDSFKEKNIFKSNSVSLRNLRRANCIYSSDAIIVGSDQVWRYRMMKDDILEMFLKSFQDLSIKKISYAASFGKDEWDAPESIKKEAAYLIKTFNAVSVREKSGVDLCARLFDVKAKLVLDPTLLLDSEDYSKLIHTSIDPEQEKTLMVYMLDRSIEKTDIINKISDITGYRINELLPKSKYENVGIKHIEDCKYCSVEEWLKDFRDAEMVITDSFHGTVFSIIFNKPFWVIGNAKRGMARFISLLELFDLKDRLIEKLPEDIYEPINWQEVNKKRSILKKESIDFLCSSLLI